MQKRDCVSLSPLTNSARWILDNPGEWVVCLNMYSCNLRLIHFMADCSEPFRGYGLPYLLNKFRFLARSFLVIRMPLFLLNEWKIISSQKTYQYAMLDLWKETFLIPVATSTPVCSAGVSMETLQTIHTCYHPLLKLVIAYAVALRICGRFR